MSVAVAEQKDEYDQFRMTITDITEQKLAEEKLQQASTYNRSLIEASLDPLVAIGPDGKITDVNIATEAVTGYIRTVLVGTNFSDYFTEPKRAQAGYQQVFREGMVHDYPLEIRHRDGHVTPVIYNASVYRDKAGKVVGIFAAARNITKRKQAEERLQEDAISCERLLTICLTGFISKTKKAASLATTNRWLNHGRQEAGIILQAKRILTFLSRSWRNSISTKNGK